MPSTKKYHRDYSRKWYTENSSLTKERTYTRRKESVKLKQAKIVEYLKQHPCADCGEEDILVLQFDHVRGEKKYVLSVIICGGHSWNTVWNEILKCDVRCANCHIRKTAKDFKNYKTQLGLSSN